MQFPLRYTILLLLGLACLCGISAAQTQQATPDDLLQKANGLMKGYTPPPPTHELPKETAAEARQNAHRERALRGKLAPPPSLAPAEPSLEQFRKQGYTKEIRKRIDIQSSPASPDEIKARMDEEMKRQGTSPQSAAGREYTIPSTDEIRRTIEQRMAEQGKVPLSGYKVSLSEDTVAWGMIRGTVFDDINGNGIQDEGESGIEGVVIGTYNYNLGSYTYDTTDANGLYSYIDTTGPGSLYHYIDIPSGWSATTATYSYPSLAGDTLTINFGVRYISPNLINGMKFNDVNGNGSRDADEPGLPGWVISVYDYSTGTSYYDTTDANGNYSITTGRHAYYYLVREVNQDGWLVTHPYRSQDAYHYLYAGGGDTLRDKNFGNWIVPESAVRGMKFNDLNGDGYKDEGEPGIPGWKILLVNYDTDDSLWTTTDSLGNYAFEGLTWAHQYKVLEENQLDWVKTSPSNEYWSFYLAGDTIIDVNFGNHLPDPIYPIRVNTMPSNSVNGTYANALAGIPLAVWGNVHGGLAPLWYVLDYGDGTIDSGWVTDRHYIGTDHTYATAGPKTMTLTVTDHNGETNTDQSVIRVYAAPSQQIRVNMAIEKGLLYNYLNQYPDGRWPDGYGSIGSTGASVLAFEENSHLPNNDYDTDIYAEYVRAGLNYLMSKLNVYNISVQMAGNPDSDGDGKGVYFYDGENYANGIGMLGVLGAHRSAAAAMNDTIPAGVYAGQTYYDLMVDAVDQIVFSQGDTLYANRGGWQYSVATSNYGNSDNSATQWPGLVLEAAQVSWGIAAPQFAKNELLHWLQYSQDATGGFGYTGPSYWNNLAKTGAGIGAYAALGYLSSSTPVANAIGFLNAHWGDTYDGYGTSEHFSGNLYTMYGVAKGLRIIDNRVGIVNVGSHNWYEEYTNHLLDHATWGQQPDGSWADGYWFPSYRALSTSFGILILTQGVIVAPPVAVIAPIDRKPPATAFQVDGSSSFHQDPAKSIVEWLWDWDASDGLNWEEADASGQAPMNPGYATPDTYTITLYVRDNSDPALFDLETRTVLISTGNNPPVAVAIPPERGPSYAAKIGEPIFLDGRASHDPDYPADSVVAYNWDLNGDNIFGDSYADTVTVVFENEHQGQVGLRVYDSRGDSSSNVAFITIVTSRKDLIVTSFQVEPSAATPGSELVLRASFMNDATSNTNAFGVLVRFYDENPLTTGNRIGNDFYVDLPVGMTDSASVILEIPTTVPNGVRNLYVFLDPKNEVAEWNEQNNIALARIEIETPPPHIVIERTCMNFGTVARDGETRTIPIRIGNDGDGVLVIDSIRTTSPEFFVDSSGYAVIGTGEFNEYFVTFAPDSQGLRTAALLFFTNDGTREIALLGHGEYEATGTRQQIFAGLATIFGKPVPQHSVIGAFDTAGTLIASAYVEVHQDSIVDGINYVLSILEGQGGLTWGGQINFGLFAPECNTIPERFCNRTTIFEPAFPPDSGYDRWNLDFAPQRSVSIPLYEGYNAVSWNVIPSETSVQSVFGDVLENGKVKIILDYIHPERGNPQFSYYIPALGRYNPLKQTSFTKGYFVKLFAGGGRDSLVVHGHPVCAEFPIPLAIGMNFISYLPEYSSSPAYAFSSLSSYGGIYAYSFFNDGSGMEFFDSYPEGAFTEASPTHGYFLESQYPMVLRYPRVPPAPGGARTVVKNSAPERSPFAVSGLPMAVFAYGTNVGLDGKLVAASTEIKAVDKDGIVCGTATFLADGVFALPIAADDPSTPVDEGAVQGEQVRIYIGSQLVAERIEWTEFGDTPVLKGELVVTDVTDDNLLPTVFAVHQNYPNPFNPVTSIRYELPRAAHVSIIVYDLLGREVRTLVNDELPGGYFQAVWDGTNENGSPVSSGLYTYRIVANGGDQTFTKTYKMLLLK